MIFEVSHKTVYRYSAPVALSHHLVHLTPRSLKGQRILRHSLTVEPAPAMRTEFVDYFGNPAAAIAIERKHSELVIHSRACIEVTAPAPADLAASPPWEEVVAMYMPGSAPCDREAIQYLPPTYYTAASPELLGFAGPSFRPGRPLLECVQELSSRIHHGFTYDTNATDTATAIGEVLKIKRGVCQDFAHLLIGALRAFGLPARYVSGYLLTHPPEGKERLAGADASHAWVSVLAPGVGWVDFDPTNDLLPSAEHITVAYGRDFQDVSPVTGVLLGGGAHLVEVAVDVMPASNARGDGAHTRHGRT